MPNPNPTDDPVVGNTAVTALAVTDLTAGTVDGAGVFDKLMSAFKAHIEQEFLATRLRGPEYATVYLGGLQECMQQAMAFLLAKTKNALEVELLRQNVANAILQGKVLIAEECKLRAEYDLVMQNVLKATQETLLLAQKVATEKAQTQAGGVDADSIVGKQKILYQAQADGFARDAEQKAAKILVDSWNVRRTTDDATVADATNKLADTFIGRAIDKLLGGVGA